MNRQLKGGQPNFRDPTKVTGRQCTQLLHVAPRETFAREAYSSMPDVNTSSYTGGPRFPVRRHRYAPTCYQEKNDAGIMLMEDDRTPPRFQPHIGAYQKPKGVSVEHERQFVADEYEYLNPVEQYAYSPSGRGGSHQANHSSVYDFDPFQEPYPEQEECHLPRNPPLRQGREYPRSSDYGGPPNDGYPRYHAYSGEPSISRPPVNNDVKFGWSPTQSVRMAVRRYGDHERQPRLTYSKFQHNDEKANAKEWEPTTNNRLMTDSKLLKKTPPLRGLPALRADPAKCTVFGKSPIGPRSPESKGTAFASRAFCSEKVTIVTDIKGLKYWNSYKGLLEILYELFVKVDSDVADRELGRKEFLIRDDLDSVWVSYYEIDEAVPEELKRGSWLRMYGVMRPWGFQAITLRLLTGPLKADDLEQKIKFSKRVMNNKVSSLNREFPSLMKRKNVGEFGSKLFK